MPKLQGPTAFVTVIGLSGAKYVADAQGMINPTALDFVPLLNAGFTIPGTAAGVLNNLTATTDPGATNDNTQDYGPGSIWLNTTLSRLWSCVSAATGAAVWVSETGGGVSSPAVTAFNGGGQASATALTQQVNRVTTTVATAPPYDSVKLPAATAGAMVIVVNATNNPIQVFGNGTDTINAAAAATGITQPPNSIDIYVCSAAGLWNAEVGVGFSGSFFTELSQDNITAFAGGGQGSATQLVAQTSRITTVATAGDSVKLPASAPGLELMVINHGTKPMQVFGLGSDQIDDQAAATGVSQMQNSLVIYTCAAAGNWYSEGLATGFGGPGLQTQSSQDSLTAKAGGGQGGGPTINRMLNRVTTVATAGDSITLPVSVSGLQLTVVNAAGANSMNVFPASGEQINALGANAAFALAAGKTLTLYCVTAGQWHTILSA